MEAQIYFCEANSSTTIENLKGFSGQLKSIHYFKKASWVLHEHIDWHQSIPVNEYVYFIFVNKAYIEKWAKDYEEACSCILHAQSLLEDYRDNDFDRASLLEVKEVYSNLLNTFNFDDKILVAYLVPHIDMTDF